MAKFHPIWSHYQGAKARRNTFADILAMASLPAQKHVKYLGILVSAEKKLRLNLIRLIG
jgi:hypothetical protein